MKGFAGPVPAVTGVYERPCGTTGTAAQRFRGGQEVFARDRLDGFGCGGYLGAVMTLAARILIARAQAASRRAARKRRTELERELAGYATSADRCDLEAALDRYPDGVTHELRSILARQYMTAQETRFPAIGRN
jgi:hypothetical protein